MLKRAKARLNVCALQEIQKDTQVNRNTVAVTMGAALENLNFSALLYYLHIDIYTLKKYINLGLS